MLDFWLPGRHRADVAELQLWLPYPRLAVAHLTVIFGAFSALTSGDHLPAVLWMVGLKSVAELLVVALAGGRRGLAA